MQTRDFLIIGGGVIGLSIAFKKQPKDSDDSSGRASQPIHPSHILMYMHGA